MRKNDLIRHYTYEYFSEHQYFAFAVRCFCFSNKLRLGFLLLCFKIDEYSSILRLPIMSYSLFRPVDWKLIHLADDANIRLSGLAVIPCRCTLSPSFKSFWVFNWLRCIYSNSYLLELYIILFYKGFMKESNINCMCLRTSIMTKFIFDHHFNFILIIAIILRSINYFYYCTEVFGFFELLILTFSCISQN